MTYRVVVSARQAANRLLGSLKGLQIRALNILATTSGWFEIDFYT
jgi:hypothetical protein